MKVCLLGSGIVGLSAAYFLENADYEIVRVDDGNPQASKGQSRIFRLAHGDPFYTDEARKSLQIWNEWEEEWNERLITKSGLWISAPWAKGRIVHGPYPLGSKSRRYVIDFSAGTGDIAKTASLLKGKVKSKSIHGRVERIAGKNAFLANGEKITADFFVVACGKNTAALLGEEERLAHHVRFRYPFADPDYALESFPALIDKKISVYGVQEQSGFAVGISEDQTLGFSKTQNLSATETSAREEFIKERRNETNQIISSFFPYLLPKPQDEVYYVHPAGRDGYRLIEKDNVLGITGNNLFKFAPLLGQIALSWVQENERRSS